MDKIRILIVEDNDFMRKSIFGAIDTHEKFSAKTGREAMSSFMLNKPHMVFLDLGLPDMNGMDLVTLFLENNASAHIVVVSGDGDAALKQTAKERGAKGYLVKPVSKNMLDEYIHAVLKEIAAAK